MFLPLLSRLKLSCISHPTANACNLKVVSWNLDCAYASLCLYPYIKMVVMLQQKKCVYLFYHHCYGIIHGPLLLAVSHPGACDAPDS